MFNAVNSLSLPHDWRLIVLAVLVCVLGSLAAVCLFQRARALNGGARLRWLLTAGIATGCGVWATHFIAILGLKPGFPVNYDLYRTVLSLAVAIAASAIGLAFAVYAKPRQRAAIGGAVIGLGAAAMHFIGMASLQMPGYIVWSPILVAASVLLAVVLGALALTSAASGERTADLAGGALLLATAVLALHYTAMSAAEFVHDPTFRLMGAPALSPDSMGVALAAVVGSMLATCLVGSISDRVTQRTIDAQNMLLDRAINNMNQGLCMFDDDGRVVVWNQRYLDMYRIDSTRVRLGCSLIDVLEARAAAGTFAHEPKSYAADLLAAIRRGKSFILNTELADGRVIAVVNQPSPDGGWVATHEDITERTHAARALERTRAFLDTVIENVPSPIIVKGGPELRYAYINRAAETYLGVRSRFYDGQDRARCHADGEREAD